MTTRTRSQTADSTSAEASNHEQLVNLQDLATTVQNLVIQITELKTSHSQLQREHEILQSQYAELQADNTNLKDTISFNQKLMMIFLLDVICYLLKFLH